MRNVISPISRGLLPVKSDFSDGVDVLVVGPEQIIHDHASSLMHRDVRVAGDLITGTVNATIAKDIRGMTQEGSSHETATSASKTAARVAAACLHVVRAIVAVIVWLYRSKHEFWSCSQPATRRNIS